MAVLARQGKICLTLGHCAAVAQRLGKATATPLEEATQEQMAVAKVASYRGISASWPHSSGPPLRGVPELSRYCPPGKPCLPLCMNPMFHTFDTPSQDHSRGLPPECRLPSAKPTVHNSSFASRFFCTRAVVLVGGRRPQQGHGLELSET